MKIIKKKTIVESDQIEHTKTERIILKEFDHPFLIKLRYACQNKDSLFLIVDFKEGGDIFFHLQQSVIFDEEHAKLYIAEIILAIKYLHEKNVIYRDLKPENILLGLDGHIVLSDFGLSKFLSEEGVATTFCGSPEYLSPDVICDEKYGKSSDLWSIGILAFEFLYGSPPFFSENIETMYYSVVNSPLEFPTCMDEIISSDAKDFIRGLLKKNPKKRLGSGEKGFDEILNHPWFKNLNWDDVYNKKIEPLFIPDKSASILSPANVDPTFLEISPEDEEIKKKQTLTKAEGKKVDDEFKNFDYSASFDTNKTNTPPTFFFPKPNSDFRSMAMNRSFKNGLIGSYSSESSGVNSFIGEDDFDHEHNDDINNNLPLGISPPLIRNPKSDSKVHQNHLKFKKQFGKKKKKKFSENKKTKTNSKMKRGLKIKTDSKSKTKISSNFSIINLVSPKSPKDEKKQKWSKFRKSSKSPKSPTKKKKYKISKSPKSPKAHHKEQDFTEIQMEDFQLPDIKKSLPILINKTNRNF